METDPLELVTAELPRPEPSEFLVAVPACGVCRTDLHVTEGDLVTLGNACVITLHMGVDQRRA